jgi:hypothetical protein
VRAYQICGRCRAVPLRDYPLTIDVIAAGCPGRRDALRRRFPESEAEWAAWPRGLGTVAQEQQNVAVLGEEVVEP